MRATQEHLALNCRRGAQDPPCLGEHSEAGLEQTKWGTFAVAVHANVCDRERVRQCSSIFDNEIAQSSIVKWLKMVRNKPYPIPHFYISIFKTVSVKCLSKKWTKT